MLSHKLKETERAANDHALSVSSLITRHSLLKHHFLPPGQAILDPLHDQTQILFAMHEVQIVAADGEHLHWRFRRATGKLMVRGEHDHHYRFHL